MSGEGLTGVSLVSTISYEGSLRIELRQVPVAPPAADEVVIRVQACPVNPSDMSLMLGPVDADTLRVDRVSGRNVITGSIPADRLPALKRRWDQPVAIGNEGAGTVVAAGSGVSHLKGVKCAAFPMSGMFATYRVVNAADLIALPDDLEPEEAAAMFVNPLTVLAMLETLQREGHSAIVHSAAASNLGQMLVRMCGVEKIPLVNIVRHEEQVGLLRALGAQWVVSSSSPEFDRELFEAIEATGATLLFDAVGGGGLTDRVLRTMEAVGEKNLSAFSRYGSKQPKQAYVYSNLDPGPTQLSRAYGMSWNVSPFSLPFILEKLGRDVRARMQERVLQDIRSTFLSRYTGTIGLEQLLDLEMVRKITRRATASKYLLDPSR